MSTIQEQEHLIEVLKFTPRTYKIQMWGYGGEKVMGTVDRKIYDYFKSRRLSLSDYAWDSDYTEDNNIPEEMQPFTPGSWYECDDMGHANGVSRNAGTLQIEDEQGNIIFEKSFDDIDGGTEDAPEWCCGDEVWIDAKPAGTIVFIGNSNEKGTFFEADLPLTAPFDITKLELQYDEIDGEEIINVVRYDGEDIDNWGGSTDGKSSDFGFYVAGSNKQDGKGYEKYCNMDDIVYPMTDWFPKKINPVREGLYNVKTAGKNSYTYQAQWNGTDWRNAWGSEEPLKIKEWQGIAGDPDEQDLRDELNRICEEFPNAEQQAGWPFGTLPNEHKENKVTEEKQSKWWTVKTYHKKNCEQVEYFVQREGEGRIVVRDGFRWCTYNVETNDGEFPKFEFTKVPGGNDACDSLDMNCLTGDNIESSELVEMFDGGCWGGWDIEGVSEEEEQELNEFLEENGAWALEDDGKWYLDETEVWIWGPISVTDEDGNERIIIADKNGNVTDFKED